jgi:STE24 endopeptidase
MSSIGSFVRVKRHDDFSPAELERSRRFNRPLHLALGLDLLLSLAALAALTQLRFSLPWSAALLVWPVLADVVPAIARLPVACFRHRHAVRFGLSTQSWSGFAVDRTKGLAIGALLTTIALAPLFAAARQYPEGWPWLVAPGAALLVLLLGVLGPVLLEPVWNRFEPLPEGPLATRLLEVARRAGTPVTEILVADASRRTRAQNAYVSGLGRTRRLVLWDTLLEAPPDEIGVVLAHELGHQARRHVALLTAAGMAGAAVFVVVLRLVHPHPVPHDAAAIVLAASLAELVTLPVFSAVSRRFERAADRFSLAVTGDPEAFRRLHHRIAIANLAELEPPKWLYYWAMSHPTAPERINSA